MIKDIQAKTLLSSNTHPDSLFGIRYTMNLYRGCQHQCIYCDSRSECYGIENFADILVKANAIELLQKELRSKRTIGTVGTGSMNDPYMPLELRRNLTGQALQIIADLGFPVHVITKSDIVLRDVELLQRISQVYAAVSFTITTADDALARKIEPGAPPSSARFKALKCLIDAGVYSGITLMPVLPYLEDTEGNITAIVSMAREAGARYILPWFGMSMRDRQRRYYYNKLDVLFPGLRQKYEKRFGNRYECPDDNAEQLLLLFQDWCQRYGIATRMALFTPRPALRGRPEPVEQLPLFH